jgi:ubiquitin-conjugating enzyme E2 variant
VLLESPAAYGFVWSTISVSAWSNQIHQWAHRPDPPRPVRALQRSGILLSLRRHASHHRAPFLDRYCITTGWMNPLLDRFGFWRALERGITRTTGVIPRADEGRTAPPRARMVPRVEATRLPSRSPEEEA